MEIILGRFAKPRIGHVSYGNAGRNTRDYSGEKEINKSLLEPIVQGSVNVSSLYYFDKDKFSDLPFNWLYFINENWLKSNKEHIFNYSYNNNQEFQEFVDEVGFPTINKVKFLKKEKNHLITSLNIPFEYVDKIMILRNYPEYFHTINYVRKFMNPKNMVEYYKTSGIRSYHDAIIPEGTEFILN